jgi:oligopeptide transport system substrate-binding protein
MPARGLPGVRRQRPSPRPGAIRGTALLLAALLAGCSGDAPRGDLAPAGLKVYRHALEQAPTSLDPVQSATMYSNHIVVNVYDTLYRYRYLARPYELAPNLAVALPEISEDKLTYTIRLRPGVRFVDDPAFPGGRGREVTAEDFVYSLKRHFDPATRPQGAWLWQGRIEGLDEWKDQGSDHAAEVPGLRALDAHTVQIRLTRPYPQLVDTLAQGYAAIVPREAVERYGREFAIRPVGSGPFRLVSFDTARVVLERNPGYRLEPVDLAAEGYDPATQAWTGVAAIAGRSPPFVDRVEVSFIPEPSAMWSSFTKGSEIQFAILPNEQVDRVLASREPLALKARHAERFQLHGGLEAGFVFANFNMDDPAFGYHPDPVQEQRNQALRCAVIKAFDWEARNESFYAGLGQVFPGIIVPMSPEFDPELPRDSVTRDVAGARALLAGHGWDAASLPELVYGTSPGVISRLFYEQFRAWLVEIGWPREKIVLRQYATFGDLSRAWRQGDLPLVVKGWGLDYPDAENTLQLFYGPNASPGSNDANYRNPAYDTLYEQAAVLLPSPERTAIYREMNRMLLDDCVAISGLSRKRLLAWHREVLMLPDREILGGFFLKFVDLAPGGVR